MAARLTPTTRRRPRHRRRYREMISRPPRYLVITVHTPVDTVPAVHLQQYTFYADHRDIAYELALQFGRETCFGREFSGLAHLGITHQRVIRQWKEEAGEADEFVVPKNALEAFSTRWFTRRCNAALLRERTFEPPFQMSLDCLDRIPWYALEHAYGNAFDVPKDIRRLTSTDHRTQSAALERLYGTIYHQGTIFPATVSSIAPLLQILANPWIRDRGKIARLFFDITESAIATPEQIKEKWAQLAKLRYPPTDYSDREIQERVDVRREMESHYSSLCELALDDDASVAETFKAVMEMVPRIKPR